MVDAKNMTEPIDDSLGDLRDRVTCPICKEIFNEPKRMPNCSHVLCLECLEKYLRSRHQTNFPRCPLCRKAITISYREINKFEPARAEADIAALVRKFEKCGFCKKNKNPNKKCTDCGKFICEKCKLCHADMKPNHILEPIIFTSESSRPVSDMCRHHKNQVLDLFCIICQTPLCCHCKEYLHEKCKDKYHRSHVMRQFSKGLLQDFVEASRERMYLLKQGRLERIVYILEFVSESKKWLTKTRSDLENFIALFKEYKLSLKNIVDEEMSIEAEIDIRRRQIADDVDIMYQCGIYLHSQCTNHLEGSTDIEVAKNVLEMEQLCLWFFRIATGYSLSIKPQKLTLECFEHFKYMFKTITSCDFQKTDYTFACILRIKRVEEEPYQIQSTVSIEDDGNMKRHEVKSELRKRFLNKNRLIYNRAVFINKDVSGNGHQTESQVTSSESNECIYVEYPGWQTGMTYIERNVVQRASSQRYGRRAPSYHPTMFYIEQSEDDDPRICLRFGGPTGERYGNLGGTLFYTTHFTNVYSEPVRGIPVDRILASDLETSTVFLNAVIGKPAPFSGVETLLIYFEDDIFNIHSISVSSRITKINLVHSLDAQYLQNTNCHLVTDELGIFSLCTATTEDGKVFHSSLRTRPQSVQTPYNVISTEPDQVTIGQVPVVPLCVDLLCTLRQGLYFVYRDQEFSKIVIGKIKENSIMNSLQQTSIRTMMQTEIGNIPIHRLKPLTLIEDKNQEMMVVSSVENTDTTFVILWPERDTPGAVEILQVEYKNHIAHSSVLDLEMDPDGNIMYALENGDGQTYCVLTKYFARP